MPDHMATETGIIGQLSTKAEINNFCHVGNCNDAAGVRLSRPTNCEIKRSLGWKVEN